MDWNEVKSTGKVKIKLEWVREIEDLMYKGEEENDQLLISFHLIYFLFELLDLLHQH